MFEIITRNKNSPRSFSKDDRIKATKNIIRANFPPIQQGSLGIIYAVGETLGYYWVYWDRKVFSDGSISGDPNYLWSRLAWGLTASRCFPTLVSWIEIEKLSGPDHELFITQNQKVTWDSCDWKDEIA